jgi:hypothetical protein
LLKKYIKDTTSHLVVVATQYEISKLASLKYPIDGALSKVFLPKRYASASEEKGVLEINEGTVTISWFQKGLEAHKYIVLHLNKVQTLVAIFESVMNKTVFETMFVAILLFSIIFRP